MGVKAGHGKSVDLDIRDVDGKTPLILAVEYGHPEIVEYLLLHKANPQEEDHPRHPGLTRSPVIWAVEKGRSEILRSLLRHGANANGKKPDTWGVPMDLAVGKWDKDAVGILLEHGADPNIALHSETLLERAINENDVHIARLLLHHGADIRAVGSFRLRQALQHGPMLEVVNFKPPVSVRLLDSALLMDSLELLQTVLEHFGDKAKQVIDEEKLLHKAAALGFRQHVLSLLKLGANIEAAAMLNNCLHRDGSKCYCLGTGLECTALHVAIAHGHSAIAGDLFEKGCSHMNVRLHESSDSPHIRQTTMLHVAAKYSQPMVDMVIQFGADLEAVDEMGCAPLHYAATGARSLETINMFSENPAFVRMKDHNGLTPLHIVSGRSWAEAVKHLLERGAEADAVDNDGRTALHLALNSTNKVSRYSRKDTRTIRYLCLNGPAQVNMKDKRSLTPLHIASGHSWAEAVELLLEQGAEVDAVDVDGRTALHLAANSHVNRHEHFDTRTIDLLSLDNRTQVRMRDKQGLTPLHLAASLGRTRAVELLLRRGAEVDAVDNNDQTPLHWALQSGSVSPRLAEMLIKAGADVNAKNRLGQSALHLLGMRMRAPGSSYRLMELFSIFVNHGTDLNTESSLGDLALDNLEDRPGTNDSDLWGLPQTPPLWEDP
ncbi:uncharacterized protein A1O5_08407 [Cladophialophora psammophila CBS 110553]|uniref:Uncharacterized protein n=1 Tax=Cladophialophora psammophila CBS 110553 TaxID=1182543 RepID=W9WL24_9EURO|nr:uncharacterized protein A1O5_08407 [Cladophialophora psammophila CBS 110553]EXJ68613.1 hypothetical protein A1O5_08407 [Cladophialophora psammophila CBS 110553]